MTRATSANPVGTKETQRIFQRITSWQSIRRKIDIGRCHIDLFSAEGVTNWHILKKIDIGR